MKDYKSMEPPELIYEYGCLFYIHRLKTLCGADHVEDDKELAKIVQEIFERMIRK